MKLVTVVVLYLNLLFKEFLPVKRHLSLNDVRCTEVRLGIFANHSHLLLRILQVAIFTIESQFETMLHLRGDPLPDRFYVLVEVGLHLTVIHSEGVEAVCGKN